MKQQLESLRTAALDALQGVDGLQDLEALRVKFLGRKGELTEILRGLATLSAEERPAMGQLANEVKEALSDAIDGKKAVLDAAASAERARAEAVDMSLPGRRVPEGHLHVITQVTEEIVGIFKQLGFQVATGPDIETEYYNFDVLNTPADHPARDSHDTFFVKPGHVLRTHTSPVQMRVMEQVQPPVAVVAPGRVYRVDYDATHSPMFFQIEGLLVDEGVTFADLKGTLMHFIHRFFGPDIQVRFRPHFFPFTEPSAEVDILWTAKDRHTGETKSRWLEILGCGMVHPEVFRHANYDYEKYSGFAFGMGLDRIAMVRHGINNIHLMYENDLRFLNQF
ncbi:MAG: phenylalanine--tRNA ligase subunit alpha [Candidatus Hydrogenedens sp.]|nr:phenylalanine--tRNA ligase subunit alpha [Candidatus Hydrogenedens sp.]